MYITACSYRFFPIRRLTYYLAFIVQSLSVSLPILANSLDNHNSVIESLKARSNAKNLSEKKRGAGCYTMIQSKVTFYPLNYFLTQKGISTRTQSYTQH